MATTAEPAQFAALLRRYRAAAGLSQDELAERAGLSRRGISDLERGERRLPHPATVRRLAAGLQLDATERAALLGSVSPALDEPARQPLPIPPTSFIGRERELAEVRRLLGCTRLLTLTGVGGSGKTRLALEAARASANAYADGIALVLLGSVADPELVAPTIARALGIRETAGRPLVESLVTFLRPRRLLLLLDNFEHLLDAATLVSDLLKDCPQLAVLATSREALRLHDEQEFVTLPLELPTAGPDVPPAALLECASVRLFAQRAAHFVPDFAVTTDTARTVADICLRLDGLPLAIELAAARTKVLSPALLLERLDHRLPLLIGGARDLPARQRTLRDTIAWSYDLLVPSDQRLFRYLAVFSGGCTLEAAEAVCESGADLVRPVLDGLTSLMDKNLLRREDDSAGEPRLIMLETIREFALDRLAHCGETESVGMHHALYFVALAEQGEPELIGPRTRLWGERFQREHDNLRSAWRWAVDHGDTDLQLRLAAGVWEFRWMYGHLSEAWQALETALANNSELSRPRAIALHGYGILTGLHGHYEPALALLAASAAAFRLLGDSRCLGRALVDTGMGSLFHGDLNSAETLLGEALALGQAAGDTFVIAYAHLGFGHLAFARSDFSQAVRVLEKGVAAARQAESPRFVAHLLANLVLALGELRQGARATVLGHECLSRMVQAGDTFGMIWALIGLAGGAALEGSLARAARLFGASEAVTVATGVTLFPYLIGYRDRCSAVIREQIGDTAFDALRAGGRALTLKAAIEYALELEERVAEVPVGTQRKAVSAQGSHLLTRREREVATLIGRGRTSREIAELLVISERTADAHAEHIRDKLRLRSRREIAIWAVEQGVLGEK